MNILITGGLGFIGSFFSERLAETGNTVRIIDNFSGHSKDAYQVLSRNKSISIFDRDIVTEKISDLFKGIDRVYHFAANSKISEGFNVALKKAIEIIEIWIFPRFCIGTIEINMKICNSI